MMPNEVKSCEATIQLAPGPTARDAANIFSEVAAQAAHWWLLSLFFIRSASESLQRGRGHAIVFEAWLKIG